MIGNTFVSFLLHTPLRSLFGDTMVITVTGRKTGKHYSAPVGFFEDGNRLWVMSSRDRTWWRNVRGGACVELYLKGHEIQGMAEVVDDQLAVEERLEAYLHAIPTAARYLGVQLQNGHLGLEDAARLARERLFVKIDLSAN
ncbi:MAG TPA: nitroreductase family deazaflavin-dependent oxidoreductase [Anaerolineales bacterium]